MHSLYLNAIHNTHPFNDLQKHLRCLTMSTEGGGGGAGGRTGRAAAVFHLHGAREGLRVQLRTLHVHALLGSPVGDCARSAMGHLQDPHILSIMITPFIVIRLFIYSPLRAAAASKNSKGSKNKGTYIRLTLCSQTA